MGEISSIQERVPKESTLPDGTYLGVWGGHVIEVKYESKIYELHTDEGVRGIGYKVVVTIAGDSWTYEELKN